MYNVTRDAEITDYSTTSKCTVITL